MDMPPITHEHLHMAFQRVALPGWTFDAAINDPLRWKLIFACAHSIRTREWERTQKRTVVPVKRVRMGADGFPVAWCTQLVKGQFEPITQPELAL